MAKPKSTSRRSVLRTGAQALAMAGLGSRLALRAEDSAALDRAVVCIYLYGGKYQFLSPLVRVRNGAAPKLSASQAALIKIAGTTGPVYGLDPALPELLSLFQSRVAAFVLNTATTLTAPAGDPGLAFFPNGFAASAWAASVAGVTLDNPANIITGLPEESGITLLTPGIFNSEDDAGRDDLRAAAQSKQFADHFPDTRLGRRLSQITSLLQTAASLGVQKPLVFCGLSTRATQFETLRELSTGMAAFYEMTVELGISQRVTTYTASPNSGGQSVVVGGSVVGGEIYGQPDGVSRDQFETTVAGWYGVRASDLPDYFPSSGGAAAERLPFLL